MKHTLMALLMVLSAASFHASGYSKSSIGNGTVWNNSNLDYTAKVNADGSIAFSGCSEGQDLAFLFTPVAGKSDEYRLSDGDNDDAVNPFSSSSRAKHLRKDGLSLLCLYDDADRLCDVLSPLEYPNGEIQAQQKWTRQLMGKYASMYDEPLTIGANGSMKFGAIDLSYRHVTFNGTITGIIEINGGTRLQGLWEAVITRDGLKLYKVEIDEYGMSNRTGEEEVFGWSRTDIPRFDYASKILLNDGQYRRLDNSLLRLMRNEIWFHHGYVPTSDDLLEYLVDKEWYTPRVSNDGVFNELSTIEKLNIELIKTAEVYSASLLEDSSQSGFDFDRYHQVMLDLAEANLNYRKSLDDIKLVSYALVDVDNDDIPEIWVRGDEGQDFQGVYSIFWENDFSLINSSDARSELRFYPNAVGASGYYGEGEFRESVYTVKDSQCDQYCTKRVLIDNYSPDQEVVEESYCVNGKDVTEKVYNAFIQRLGEPYDPQVKWYKVNPLPNAPR